MKKSNYINLCEELWANWKINNEFIKMEISNELFKHIHSAIHCPEPYLQFRNINETNNTFFFLTTNPGNGDNMQLKSTILSNTTVVKFNDDYKQNALNLGMFYMNSNFLKGQASKRIESMNNISNFFNCNGFMQMECFPFHSGNLPNYKNEIIQLSKVEGTFINKYISSLKEYCVDKNIIAISAGNNPSKTNLSNWAKFQCDIIGLSIEKAKCSVLKYSKKGNASVILLVDDSDGKFKGLYLTQGSNGFNGDRVIDMLNS